MAADPLLAAPAMSATDRTASAVEEQIMPSSDQTGLVPSSASPVADIFAGVIQEDLAPGPPEGDSKTDAGDELEPEIDSRRAGPTDHLSPHAVSFIDPGTEFQSQAPVTASDDASSKAKELTETLRSANGPPSEDSVVSSIKAISEVAALSREGLIRALNIFTPVRPLLFLPGIGGTFPAANWVSDWYWNRGIEPEKLQIDPIGGTYNDLIQTLDNVGYTPEHDFFVANYDWRMPPGPNDGTFDGKLTGLTATGITDSIYETGVDYLGYWLKKASDAWAANHGGTRPSSVDVIGHSTGNLVIRAYLQSDAYGGIYEPGKALPEIFDFVSMAAPYRGSALAWNLLHNDWDAQPTYRIVFSQIINNAYKVYKAGTTILGPDGNLTPAMKLGPTEFIEKYVPTVRGLLATYDFLDTNGSDGQDVFTNVNESAADRNWLMLDLNDGLDFDYTMEDLLGLDWAYHPAAGPVRKPTGFIDKLQGDLTVIYSVLEKTLTNAVQHVGPVSALDEVQPFNVFLGALPAPNQTWYEEAYLTGSPENGDGVVPKESSLGLFQRSVDDKDPNLKLSLREITVKAATPCQESLGHSALVSNQEAQQRLLDALIGAGSYSVSAISRCGQYSATAALLNAINANILDPLEIIANVNINSVQSVIKNGVDRMAFLAEDVLSNASFMSFNVPIVNKPLNQLLDVHQIVTSAFANLTNYLSGQLTSVQDLLDKLHEFALFADGLNYFGLAAPNRIFVNIPITKTFTSSELINFGAGANTLGLGIDVNAAYDAEATFTLDFSFGVDLNTSEFFIRKADLAAGISVQADALSLAGHFGNAPPINFNVVDGKIAMAGSITAKMLDPSPNDGKITLAELNAGSSSTLFKLLTKGSLDAQFPLTAQLGSYNTAIFGVPTIRVTDNNLFNNDAPDISVDFALNPALEASLLDLLDQLDAFAAALSAVPALNSKLSFIADETRNTLNSLFHNSPGPNLGDFFKLKQLAQTYLGDNISTVRGFMSAVLNLVMTKVGDNAQTAQSFGPVHVTGGLFPADGEVRFDVEIDFSKTRQETLKLDGLATDYGLTVGSTSVPLTLTYALKTKFGFGLRASDLVSFVRITQFDVSGSANTSTLNFDANLGILGVHVNNGSLAFSASAAGTLTDSDNHIYFSEINSLSGLFSHWVWTTAPIAPLTLTLPITTTFGGYSAPAGAQIVITDTNLLAHPPPTVTATGLSNLVDFSNITPTQVVDLLKRLGDWLATYRNSEFFDLELPFTGGKRVGDWFDSGKAFVDSIYKRMIRREVVATGEQAGDFRTLGRLTADAHFQVTVGSDAPVSVTVNHLNTSGNSSLGHAAADFDAALPAALAAKVQFILTPEGRLSLALKDGQTADTLKLAAASASDPIVTEAGFAANQDSTVAQRFYTVQDFAALLNTVLAPFVFTPAYDPVTREVTMAVHFDWIYSKAAPINLGGALGPISNFSTTAQFNITATLTFDFTLGFALKPKNTPQLVTTAFVPPPSDGKLHANSSFYVIVGSDAPVLVTLSAAATNANNSLANLAAYINTRLAAAGLSGKVRASVTSANHLALAVLNEDRDGDGHLDIKEDLAEPGHPNGDGILDRIEDLPQPGFPAGDGRLDVFEDLNGDGILQSWEDADGDGYLDIAEDFDGNNMLGAVNEDIDGDGRLDVAEDTLIVNGVLDSLLGIQTLRIVADATDPIFTEVGFLPETARAESRGLFLDNAQFTGTLNVTLTGLAASARFSVFGIQVTDGSASGNAAFDVMLRNRAGTSRRIPLNELFAATNSGTLSQMLSSSSGLNTQPTFIGSLNLTLGHAPNLNQPSAITLSPPFFTLPDDARIIIAIPDITRLRNANGQLAIHAGTDLVVPTNPSLPGIWVVYPNLDGLFHFSCLDIPNYVLALDQLVQDLGQLSKFSFLKEPLPLINQSFSELIGQVGKLAQWLNDVRSDPGDTLTALETKLETALDIDPSLITLSIDNVPNPSLAPNGTAVFNPQGGKNALFFTNNTANKITVRILDEGHITGTTNTATANWDGANNILTIEVNSGHTTAENVRVAVSNYFASSSPPFPVAPVTVTLGAADAGNDGSGVITKTALKLHLNYTLGYGDQQPFELNLADLVPYLPQNAAALLGAFTSFIDVQGSGLLNISASAAFTIDFGLDVTNPCAPRPFLYDTTTLKLKGRVTATDLDFKAALSVFGIFVENGSAALDGDGNAATPDDLTFSLDLIDNNGDGRHYFNESFFNSSNLALNVAGGLGVELPLFFPAQSLPFGGSAADANQDTYPDNYLVFKIPSLPAFFAGPAFNSNFFLITPDFNSLLPAMDLCSLIQSSGILLDGLDELLGKIESGLDKVALSGNFPLVGDKLAQGANFIRSFRNGLLGDLRARLDTVGGDPIGLVKQAFWNVLGQPGLDILVDPSTGLDTLTSFNDLDIQCTGSEVLFNLRLKKSIAPLDTSADPLAIDLGIPSLGLEINGSVKVELGFDLRLKFGINKTDGFYFNTDNTYDDDFPAGGSGRPELIVDLNVTVPNLDVTGSLFFLQLNVKDGHTAHIGHPPGDHGPNDSVGPSSLHGRFTVDVVGTDAKLTFNEMRSSAFSFENTFKAVFSLAAEVNLDLRVTFGGDATFPNFAAEFDLDWSWSSASPSGPTLNIAFNHLTIDAGSYISNLLVPILRQVQKVTGPIEPVARMLVTPIPGLSDLSGNEVTFLDLAEATGYLKPSTRKFIETVVKIVTIINEVGGAANTAGPNALTFDLGRYVVAGTWPTAIGQVATVSGPVQQSESAPAAQSNNPAVNALRKVLSDLREMGFEFPILSVGEIFKLIQGRPATLVEYHMPVLEFSFTFSQSISIYPPFLTLVLGGTVSATIDLTFGFDTYGILVYKQSRNVLDILQGIYIKDTDSNGVEAPEVVLSGGIFVGVAGGVSFGPIEVLFGAGGGVFLDLEFDLNDPDADGKVRALEILANARRDIRCIFDIEGRVYLVISVFLKVKAVLFKFEKQWDFPEITLFEFDLTCPPPILAHTESGGQLVLHTGPNAHLREEIDTDDNGEAFVVQHLGGASGNERVMVKWNGFQKEFDGVSSIVADGGDGNDTLDARGVFSPVQFRGGAGDDLIYASNNPNSVIHGDAGNDTLIGAANFANTQIWGDDGNDTIKGGALNDILRGGPGNDTITGNGGDDRLYGDDGNDALISLSGSDFLDGGPGNDLLDAGEGDDRLVGGDGNDKMLGGRGHDWLVGGLGADTLDGGTGRDILVGDDAAGITVTLGSGPAVTWNVTGAFSPTPWTISGSSGPSAWDIASLTGEGDDLLIGGAGEDLLFGGGGNDTMFGGALAVSGVPTPMEADGVDFMDGGAGDDVEYADDAFAPVGARPSGPSVSGRVWSDTNGDGLQDSGEPGMAGVTVELYNGVTFVLEDTVMTNPAGEYRFVGLHAGEYYVKFGKLVPSQVFSPKDAGNDDALDSDSDIDTATVPGKTALFTLAANDGKTGLDAGLRGPPVVVIDDVTRAEGTLLGTTSLGNATYGTTAFTFTVSLSAPSAQPVTVNYAAASGLTNPAVAGADFTETSGALTFTPGTTRLTITVPITAENIYEGNEDFRVLLSNALEGGSTALTLAKATGQGLILDDDPKPGLTIDDRAVIETPGGTTIKFTLQLSNPSSQTITVGWTTADAVNSTGEVTLDSAHFGADYAAASGTITFLPGVTKMTDVITVNVADDAFDERDEHFWIVLANPTHASILDGFGDAMIEDNDAPPVASISPGSAPISASEGDAGYHTANFAISLSAPSALPVKVTWATARGTATDLGTASFDQPDFLNDTGAVIFTPGGPLSQTITVKVLGDTQIEGLEYFFVNLIRADNATIGDNHGVVEISNDDTGADVGPWNVQFSDLKYYVQEDAGFAAITLVRPADSSEAIVVLHTQNGSATAGLDYLSRRTLVRFAEDETEKTILVPILNDALIEDTETVSLFLRNPTGGVARGEFTAAALYITDDEPRPSVTIDDAIVTEGDSGTTSITFTLHLSAPAEIPVQVNWSTNNRSAIGGFDYTTAAGAATFGVHALTTTITVTIKNDLVAEPVEEFVINLGLPVQAVIDDHQALGRIYDNDKTPITGRVFLDEDSDGYFDFFERGLAGLQVMITDYANTSVSVTTDSAGAWTTIVLMGATRIAVPDPGPPPGLPPGLTISTGNNPQTVTISDTVATAGDVGYKPDLVPAIPAESIGEASGGLDDTVFGGTGNDVINGGGGNDHLIGGHWLLGPSNSYDAFLVQANSTSRILLSPLSMNAGGAINGRAFIDANQTSLRDAPDTPAAHITVNLFDSSYALVASAVTAPNGAYSFTHLSGGDYFVQFVAPPGLRFIPPNAGSDAIDSDADTITGFTTLISINPSGATTVNNVDAGLTNLPSASSGPWAVSFDASAYNAWESASSATVILTRVPGSAEPLAVLSTQNGTALAGSDYTAIFRRLIRFADTTTEQIVTLSITPDNASEGLETVLLFLRNPTGGPVNGQRPNAVLLIFDTLRPADDQLTGSHGDDILLGDDGFVDSAGLAILIGGNGHDTLTGGSGFDALYGQDGNDRFEGGAGDDLLVGGMGNDTYFFDTDMPAGADALVERPGAANGIDTLDFSRTTSVAVKVDLSLTSPQDVSNVGNVSHLGLTLSDANAIENVIGSSSDDTLLGNDLDNVMTGGPGSDVIDGRLGADTLIEIRDVDFVLTDATLGVVAPAELDTLASIERVELAGGPGNNRFDVTGWTGGPVSIDGRAGTDTIIAAGDSNFTLTNAQLSLSSGAAFLLSSIDRAELTGGPGANLLDAAAFTGATILTGGKGNDTLLGGPGDTLYVFDADTELDSDTLVDIGGIDTLDFSGTSAEVVTVDLGNGAPQFVNTNLTLNLSSGSTIENLIGGGDDDTLLGNALDNVMTGGPGSDVIDGRLGADTLIEIRDVDFVLTNTTLGVVAPAELDTLASIERVELAGGPGNNRFDVTGWTGAPVNIDGRSGTDTIVSANDSDFTLTNVQLSVGSNAPFSLASIERAELTGGGSANHFDARTFTGAVVLSGGAGADTFRGSSGGSTFFGGLGDDTYFFDADLGLGAGTIHDSGGNDTLDFSGTTAAITVDLSNAAQQTINVNLKLTLGAGSTIENVLGGAGHDTLTGNASNNRIDGGNGNDTLAGGLGDDTYVFRDGWNLDAVIEAAGQGIDTLDFSAISNAVAVNAASSLFVTSGANTATHAGSNVESVMGGSANDIFNVTPSAATGFFVDGGSGTNDILNINAAGLVVTSNANPITVTGRQPVAHAGFEQINIQP